MTVSFSNPFLPDGTCVMVKILNQIAGYLQGRVPIGRKVAIPLTSKEWAILARDIADSYADRLKMPNNLPTPANFSSLRIGPCVFYNARTDDEQLVWQLRAESAASVSFQGIRQAFSQGGEL